MSIYDKKYQIFVSSTYVDLVKAREEVIKVILGLYQIPIGMEMFSADNEEQWSVIKSTIDNSDYYILIVGHRYGSVTKEGVSYTEKEFDYAKANSIPIMAFVRDRNHPTTPEQRDADTLKMDTLNSFVKKVTDNAMCDFWKTESELGQKVALALTKMFFKSPRVGWVRPDKLTSQETTEELTNLIKENRELRSELERLQAENNKELPIISIEINNSDKLELQYKEIYLKEFIKVDYSENSEDLLGYVSKEYIDNYNKTLDNKQDEIEMYKSKLNEYNNKKNNNIEIKIRISNTGKIKANDLYVDLTFPSEVCVFEKDDLEDLQSPNKPNLPENPISVALRKKDEEKTSFSSITIGNSHVTHISNLGISPKLLRTINVNRRTWVDTQKNNITIKVEKLSHTRTITIDDDILIAPIKKGKFYIKVSVICDEYKDTEEFRIPIIVT